MPLMVRNAWRGVASSVVATMRMFRCPRAMAARLGPCPTGMNLRTAHRTMRRLMNRNVMARVSRLIAALNMDRVAMRSRYWNKPFAYLEPRHDQNTAAHTETR